MSDPITLVLSSLTSTLTLARTALEARDASKRAEAIRQIEERLISSQQALITEIQNKGLLVEENTKLKNRISEMERAIHKEREYPLTEVFRGIYVRVHHDTMKPLVSRHKLCANCFEKGIYASLNQDFFDGGYSYWRLTCNECENLITFKEFLPG